MRKQNRSDQEKLKSFVLGVVNAKIMTVQLASLLTIDTTAVPTLKEIYEDTREDFSENGRVLQASSERYLELYQKARMEYRQKKELSSKSKIQENIHRVVKPKEQLPQQKATKITVDLSKELEKRYLPHNDENQNILNIERKIINQTCDDKMPEIYEKKLTEIIRPQYKKKIHLEKRGKITLDEELAPNQMRTNRTYVTESEDSEDIPIIKNQIKSQRDMSMKLKNGSVSPKHEGRRIQQQLIHNISQISKNYQTQTDHSFEIDLQSMGIVPEIQQRSERTNLNFKAKERQAESPLQSIKIYGQDGRKKRMQGEIQEEEPWECDEQEIEEQIRQINQRLSHRANNSQRAKTQHDIARFETKISAQTETHRINEQPRKKQTKTVRLSLTPIKNKSVGKINPNKKEVQQAQCPKTPKGNNKKIIFNKYEINYPAEEHSPIEVQCAKWKVPQKGLISAQIHKQIKNR